MASSVAIVTLENDLHAMAVEERLKNRFGVSAHLICVDALASKVPTTWQNGDAGCSWNDFRGERFEVGELGAIWWRRSRASQSSHGSVTDEAQVDLINHDWRAYIRGSLISYHRGAWISHPDATEQASFKLPQLKIAQEAGFRVPKTIVSNDLSEIRSFIDSCPSEVIIKPVAGTTKALLFTQKVDESKLEEDSVSLVPAIYQECIDGTDHLRLNVFGDSIFSAVIRTRDLDWRGNLNVPVEEVDLDPEVRTLTIRALRSMNLAMGIVDIKISSDGEPVWFEVNPQGQFLFLEGLSKQNLLDRFCEYLVESAKTNKAVDSTRYRA